jgi:hypothetical protein
MSKNDGRANQGERLGPQNGYMANSEIEGLSAVEANGEATEACYAGLMMELSPVIREQLYRAIATYNLNDMQVDMLMAKLAIGSFFAAYLHPNNNEAESVRRRAMLAAFITDKLTNSEHMSSVKRHIVDPGKNPGNPSGRP